MQPSGNLSDFHGNGKLFLRLVPPILADFCANACTFGMKRRFAGNPVRDEGNGSDSKTLDPLVKETLINTQRPIATLSADDGYASAAGVEEVRSLGVDKVSISGAKGRRLLGEELWYDEQYQGMRNDRSAVESLMYVLKYSFAFDRMGAVESLRYARRCMKRSLSTTLPAACI